MELNVDINSIEQEIEQSNNDLDDKNEYLQKNKIPIDESNEENDNLETDVASSDFEIHEVRVKEHKQEQVFYSIGQVEELLSDLNITKSTIRYWTTTPEEKGGYAEFFNLQQSGKKSNRFYTRTNIDQIKYIHNLIRINGMTSKQVQDWLKTPQAQLLKPIESVNNELVQNIMGNTMVDGISETVTFAVSTVIREFKNEIKQEFTLQIDELNERIDKLEENMANQLTNANNEIEAHLHEGKAIVDYLRKLEEDTIKMRSKLNHSDNNEEINNEIKKREGLIKKFKNYIHRITG